MGKVVNLDSSADQDAVMKKYRTLGFVRDNRDEEGLHMSFSPYRVAKGLTKLQVRRRINKYFATKDTRNPLEEIKKALGHRITILMDGRFFSGISVNSDVTRTNKTWLKFIREYLKMLESPKRPTPKGF